jgi:hypothetical protein
MLAVNPTVSAGHARRRCRNAADRPSDLPVGLRRSEVVQTIPPAPCPSSTLQKYSIVPSDSRSQTDDVCDCRAAEHARKAGEAARAGRCRRQRNIPATKRAAHTRAALACLVSGKLNAWLIRSTELFIQFNSISAPQKSANYLLTQPLTHAAFCLYFSSCFQ